MEVSGQIRNQTALFPGKEDPRRLGGPQSRSGRVGEEQNSSRYRETNPGRPAHSLVTILTEVPGYLKLLYTQTYCIYKMGTMIYFPPW
jgi:hypothetical protein